MTSSEKLNANGSSHKKSTHPRTDVGKSPVEMLPDAARLPAPNKMRTITVYQKRDALAVFQVTAAMAIPSDLIVTEQAMEALVESTEALYHDFQAADPIDSILATLMCGISSMTMDAISRGRRSPTLEQRDMELKSATRGALAIAELTKAYDGRRARDKQTVNVGQVNVEAGGQAVVGNVTSASRPGEVAHPASMPQDECVGNATSGKRPEEATSPPKTKIGDSAPPKK
jgi:hypothetical protein